MRSPRSGFTLLELMIVVALIGLFALSALSRSLTAVRAANETAAISILTRIHGAQNELVARNAIDTDGDGRGEFAWLGELAGLAPARRGDGFGNALPGRPGVDELRPAALDDSLGAVSGGVLARDGYRFALYLPDAQGSGIAEPESADAVLPDSDLGERTWCCYAWPEFQGFTGSRMFWIDQEGVIHESAL